ncbi:hypothetical protein [Mammaliicoccus sciuri]|uniref:hypothetical protein n=1 Tax=Mammaliicoccus sciuri TaxID=1296 RepID=UPI001FB448E7|nr:hypothetical protein [Mammaliicoccus sciuri]MCJ0941337.1 hypothetical protein [Mammaliicoccus sciuri]
MEFTYYKTKDLNAFENDLKVLALNKNYQFSKETEVLKEDEILEKSSGHERDLLKIFKNNAQFTTYHFKNHKSNYLIIVGETNLPNIFGLTVIFDKKPFKQLGKIAIGSLIALASGGGILAMGAVFGILTSVARRTLVIKGPLGKEIAQIIENRLGKPIEIKS